MRRGAHSLSSRSGPSQIQTDRHGDEAGLSMPFVISIHGCSWGCFSFDHDRRARVCLLLPRSVHPGDDPDPDDVVRDFGEVLLGSSPSGKGSNQWAGLAGLLDGLFFLKSTFGPILAPNLDRCHMVVAGCQELSTHFTDQHIHAWMPYSLLLAPPPKKRVEEKKGVSQNYQVPENLLQLY